MPFSTGATPVQGTNECGQSGEGLPVTVQGCPGGVPVPIAPAPGTCLPVQGCPGGPPVEVTGPAGAPVDVEIVNALPDVKRINGLLSEAVFDDTNRRLLEMILLEIREVRRILED